MRILFWNTHGNNRINPFVVSIVQDYDVDIVLMAEYCADPCDLNNLLKKSHQRFAVCNTLGCQKISIWSNYVNVEPDVQHSRYSIQIINNEWILCCVHLMSDLHGDYSDERLVLIQQIMYDIRKVEQRVATHRIIIIGDMNEMPYDKGCLSANGFHGLPVLNLEDSNNRNIYGKAYEKFYNPMWNLMGDRVFPPGTYYWNNSRLYSPMWYMLDQVIISKEVIPFFSKENLEIIVSCKYADLRDSHNRPNKDISDHFPIICEIINKI